MTDRNPLQDVHNQQRVEKELGLNSFFFDKVGLYLSLLAVLLIGIDTAANLLPGGADLQCFIPSNVSATKEQTDFVNAYCDDQLPRSKYIAFIIFLQSFTTTALYVLWDAFKNYHVHKYAAEKKKISQSDASDRKAGDKKAGGRDKSVIVIAAPTAKQSATTIKCTTINSDVEITTGDESKGDEKSVNTGDDPEINPLLPKTEATAATAKESAAATASTTSKETYRLVVSYFIKNILQIVCVIIGIIAVFWESHWMFNFDTTFLCYIHLDENWSLSSVQCDYTSVALIPIFLATYLTLSICILLAGLFGLLTLFLCRMKCKCITDVGMISIIAVGNAAQRAYDHADVLNANVDCW